ncbi:MAG: sigma-70 family RNA polymerase sigma factor [Oscillospiraceae bacterium]|jgi:RNA polymerase sigma-70 factor (ECF subfamily)|nr:sigma-70 family RNA polymerase sigma factor [Oscillospiraceae bacterium]
MANPTGILDELQRYRTDAYRLAYMFTGSRADAEDAVQDAYEACLTNPPRDRRNLKAWLLTVTRSKALNTLRRARDTGPLDENLPAPEPCSLEMLDCLRALPGEAQQIVVFKVLYGFKHREIAHMLGLAETDVRKRYERAKRQLKEAWIL